MRLFQELIVKDTKVILTFRLQYSLQFETEVHLVNDLLSILEYYCGNDIISTLIFLPQLKQKFDQKIQVKLIKKVFLIWKGSD